jgi:hypothetical protein
LSDCGVFVWVTISKPSDRNHERRDFSDAGLLKGEKCLRPGTPDITVFNARWSDDDHFLFTPLRAYTVLEVALFTS